MAGYLEDLDELILKCRNKNAREYIRESVASYRSEAYRSAIVSCWVAVCYDLIEKLRELSLAGDKQAAQKIEILDKIHRDNDTGRSLKFEREILEFARDKLELISALEYEDLHRILKDRHRCAHPALNAEGDQYTPPAELARLHIHSAVTHLLQHEPAQGKFALDRILAQLGSKYFPYDQKEVLKAFQNGPVRRARPSLVRGLITVLLKDLFLKEQKDYTTVSKLSASLNAINSMHRSSYEERCAEILGDIISQAADEKLHQIVTGMCKLERGWEFLDETQQGRLSRYVESIPTDHFHIVDELLSYRPLEKVAKRRVKYATLDDLREIFPFIVPVEIVDRAIQLYHQAYNFDEANKLAVLLRGFSSEFNDGQISLLLANIKSNSQITGSFELPQLLESIRENLTNKPLDFDEMLREHGLEEYVEVIAEEDDIVPF